jgi:hypothetical protein
MLGKEDIPTSHRNTIMKGKTYMDTVAITAIHNVNSDKTRNLNNFNPKELNTVYYRNTLDKTP